MDKVGEKAKIESKEVKPVEVEVRVATPEELAAQIAGEAVKQTMDQFMPVLERVLNKVSEQQQVPAQTNVTIQEDLTSIQSRVVRDINRQFDARVQKNRKFMESLTKAPRSHYVRMSIPRVFAKYFGSELPVGLNGSVIQVPINGRPFVVHKDFVPIIQQTLNYEDQKISFMEQTNFEDVTEASDIATLGQQ